MDQQIAMSLLILIIFGFPMMAVFIVMLFDSMGSKKSKFLFFTSPNHAIITSGLVKDAKVKMGKKQFDISGVKTKMLRGGTLFRSYKPLYILRWNYHKPYQWDDDKMEVTLTSESNKLLSRNTTLETLLRGGGTSMSWIWLILGVVIGVMVGYMLISTGLIPITLPPAPPVNP